MSKKSVPSLSERLAEASLRTQLLTELANSLEINELAEEYHRAVEALRRASGAVRRAEAERDKAVASFSDARELLRIAVAEWRERGVTFPDLSAALGVDHSALRSMVIERGEKPTRARGRRRGGARRNNDKTEAVSSDAKPDVADTDGQPDGGEFGFDMYMGEVAADADKEVELDSAEPMVSLKDEGFDGDVWPKLGSVD
jgi:hypothetical protein